MSPTTFASCQLTVTYSDCSVAPGVYMADLRICFHRSLRTKVATWDISVALGGQVWTVLNHGVLAQINRMGQPIATLKVDGLPTIPGFDGLVNEVPA